MKLKQNLFLKIVIFLLALVFFAAAAAMAIYQVANFNVLWADEKPIYGFTAMMLFERNRGEIDELIRLSEAQPLDTWSQRRLETLEEELDAEHTNLRWQVRRDNVIYYGNESCFPDRVAFYVREVHLPNGIECELLAWLDPELALHDEYLIAVRVLEAWKADRTEFLAGTAACVLLSILCTVYLCVTCGHKKGVEGIHLNWFHHIPGDLLLAAYVLGVAACGVGIGDAFGYYYSYIGWEFRWILIFTTLCVTGIALLVISFLVTFVARCKGRVLLRHTVIGWVLGWLWKLCRTAVAAVPMVWRVALAGVAYLLLSVIFIAASMSDAFWAVLWMLMSIVLVLYLCWWALQWKKLRQGTREIISGNAGYQIENSKMPPDLRDHADELNNLGQAIGAAVDERMRSEHFKAELITNVSHDLKTPLTSIISYVDLLKKEDIENPKVQEYIEVLDRKSQRLKKLTEDLVEASKASAGVLNVTLGRLDLVQLVDQALAEYEDRLAGSSLTVVRTLPVQPIWVVADGRHLWRVVDNLLSNCAKYALEGTRVYVEVQQRESCAYLTVKNISRDELNVPAERLTERFVRGDESRTMEGSGLGLSIAQSLTDLQSGTFEVSVDGDLFKATLTLPKAAETELL